MCFYFCLLVICSSYYCLALTLLLLVMVSRTISVAAAPLSLADMFVPTIAWKEKDGLDFTESYSFCTAQSTLLPRSIFPRGNSTTWIGCLRWIAQLHKVALRDMPG